MKDRTPTNALTHEAVMHTCRRGEGVCHLENKGSAQAEQAERTAARVLAVAALRVATQISSADDDKGRDVDADSNSAEADD